MGFKNGRIETRLYNFHRTGRIEIHPYNIHRAGRIKIHPYKILSSLRLLRVVERWLMLGRSALI